MNLLKRYQANVTIYDNEFAGLGGDNAVSTGFTGCLKSFSLDGTSLHFARAADLSQVSSACPLNNNEKDSAIKSEQNKPGAG